LRTNNKYARKLTEGDKDNSNTNMCEDKGEQKNDNHKKKRKNENNVRRMSTIVMRRI
jgi:hypothetical protein